MVSSVSETISETKWTKMQNTSIPTFVEKAICCYFSQMLTEFLEHISSVSCYYREISPCLSKNLEKHNVLIWEKQNISGQTVHLIVFGFTKKVAAVFRIATMFLIYCCVHISLFACLILSVQTGANDSKYFEMYSPLSFCLYLLRRQEHLSSKSFTDFNSSAFLKHTGFMREAHQSHSYSIFIYTNQSSVSLL